MFYRFDSVAYMGFLVHLQFYATDEVGFKKCDFARGVGLPGVNGGSVSLLVPPEYLSNTTNYFIGN